jgi:hypothetical protein
MGGFQLMHRRIGLIAGGAAVTLAAVAGITGCSSSKSNGTTGANGSSNGNGNGGAVALSPVAEIQAALTKASGDKTVHVTGTITAAGQNGTLDAQEQFGSNLEMSVTMSLSGMDISEVLVGDTLYMKIPELSSELGGKPWAKISLSSMGSMGSTFQSLIDSAKNTDPTAQLQPLLAAGDLHKVGTETVDGVQATHYSGTVDPATAFDSSQAAKNLTSTEISQLKSMLKDAGVTKETIDVWVASTGLPVRETVTANSNTGATKVDMHLSDWGAPVTVTVPPADQVTDLSSMMGGLASSTPNG